MRIAFVTNICPHYRVKTFETLAYYHDVDYFFYSAGDEWYWPQNHGVRSGNFNHTYLRGFRLGHTRFTPDLPLKLWRNTYHVYIKCINGRFALPITYLIARLKRKPFILWTGLWMRLHTPAHRLLLPLTQYLYRHADAIVVYGEHIKRYLISEGVPECRVFVAAHAVDNECYNRQVSEEEQTALREELGIPARWKVILYLGRLEESKGLPYLLEAFESLQRDDVVLVVAGDGSQRAYLEQLVHERNLASHVRFPGYIPPERTLPYYSLAWVYVLPSVTTPTFKEPWGLVVNEAFNQGLPVITSDSVGAAAGGLVQDGINGFIVPERNSVALAHALSGILEPGLRERMSANARQTIAGWDNERMLLGFRQAIQYVTGCRESMFG